MRGTSKDGRGVLSGRCTPADVAAAAPAAAVRAHARARPCHAGASPTANGPPATTFHSAPGPGQGARLGHPGGTRPHHGLDGGCGLPRRRRPPGASRLLVAARRPPATGRLAGSVLVFSRPALAADPPTSLVVPSPRVCALAGGPPYCTCTCMPIAAALTLLVALGLCTCVGRGAH